MKNLNTYYKYKINMILMGFIIFGALNYGLTVFGFNIIDIVSNSVDNLINKQIYLDKIIYVIIGISALMLMFNRTTWLPFLGTCVFPSKGLIPNKINNDGDKKIEVLVKPNTRIAYWSSILNKSTDIPDVVSAYDDFSNSGVVTSDNTGIAILSVKLGTDYIVPSNKLIKRHVHYRELDLEYGMIGEVQTVYY
jgi:uncharacterized membrane protein YuzA (DUF378 family)